MNSEDYLAAEEALHAVIVEALEGNGESSEEVNAYISLLMEVASNNYAAVVSSIENEQEMYEYGALLFNRLFKTLDATALTYTGDTIMANSDSSNLSADILQEIIENMIATTYTRHSRVPLI